MTSAREERILIVESNSVFRERIAQDLQARNYDTVTVESGVQALLLLRDRGHSIDWLYSRASLPGLIDGWILADEYHDSHPNRAAVIAASSTRSSAQGHIVLKDPSPAGVVRAIWCSMAQEQSASTSIVAQWAEQRIAA
jgi:CheY-like chemotaxis protein